MRKSAQNMLPDSNASRVLRAMRKGPQTSRQLAEATGLTVRYISFLMVDFRRLKLAHRCGYTQPLRGDRGGALALFTLGPGEEPKKPKPQTPAARQLRYRTRIRKEKKEFQKNPAPRVASVFELGDLHKRYR
jgi:hypothetical protein